MSIVLTDEIINPYFSQNFSPEVCDDIVELINLILFFNVDPYDLRDSLHSYILDENIESSYCRYMVSEVLVDNVIDVLNQHGIYIADTVSDVTVYKEVLNTLKMLQLTEDFYALSAIIENKMFTRTERFIELIAYYNNIDKFNYQDNIDRVSESFFDNLMSFIESKENAQTTDVNKIDQLNAVRKTMFNFNKYVRSKYNMFVVVGYTLLEDDFPINRTMDYYFKILGINYIDDMGNQVVSCAYNYYSLLLLNYDNLDKIIVVSNDYLTTISEDNSFNFKVSNMVREIDLDFNKYLREEQK